MRELAESGSLLANLEVGLAFMAGRGVKQDFAEAERWFRIVAAVIHP